MTENGGGIVFANTSTACTLTVTDNIMSHNHDNGVALIGTTVTTANISISNNQIIENTNNSNGIALTHSGTLLNLDVTNNTISNNEGSGILMYPGVTIQNVTMNIENNTINNNQNLGSNSTGGIDIEQYINLSASRTDNRLSDNNSSGLYVGSTAQTPFVYLTLRGNSSNTNQGYVLVNTVDGDFNLAPCNVDIANIGTIVTTGTITPVQ